MNQKPFVAFGIVLMAAYMTRAAESQPSAPKRIKGTAAKTGSNTPPRVSDEEHGAFSNEGKADGNDEPIHVSPEDLERFNDWKYGLFIHWGPWSQTGKGSDTIDALESENGYELYKTFNPGKYDPKQWAGVAKQAGFRFAVLTTRHMDAFCMWDTKQSPYRITSPDCPYSKNPNPDIVGEYVKAFRNEGLGVGLYFLHQTPKNPIANDPYHPADWNEYAAFEKELVQELLSGYGRIDILRFDNNIPDSKIDALVPVLKMARRLQPHMLINNRGAGRGNQWADYLTTAERKGGAEPNQPWQVEPKMVGGGGYFYQGEESESMGSSGILRTLLSVAGKGGVCLLNVAPRPDGSIREQEVEALLEAGKWLKSMGEAVYGTRANPWGWDKKPDWGFVTRKGNKVFLILDTAVKRKMVTVEGVAKRDIRSITLLKDGSPVSFREGADGVEVEAPEGIWGDVYPVIVVTFNENPFIPQGPESLSR
ncbi:MAG: alpha-L-fucosidase [Candidatus Sumerlaeota bacterium]|nr:alpha-L-fucosidase [Candidatus Sumerlaeota bacterium]